MTLQSRILTELILCTNESLRICNASVCIYIARSSLLVGLRLVCLVVVAICICCLGLGDDVEQLIEVHVTEVKRKAATDRLQIQDLSTDGMGEGEEKNSILRIRFMIR